MPIAKVTEETYTRKNLRGGSDDIRTSTYTIRGNQGVIADLTVMSIDQNGKAVKHDPYSESKEERAAKFILPHGFETTEDDKVAVVFTAGCFNPDELVWSENIETLLSQQASFAGTPISIRKPLDRT